MSSHTAVRHRSSKAPRETQVVGKTMHNLFFLILKATKFYKKQKFLAVDDDEFLTEKVSTTNEPLENCLVY